MLLANASTFIVAPQTVFGKLAAELPCKTARGQPATKLTPAKPEWLRRTASAAGAATISQARVGYVSFLPPTN
jgi:hypothetical protein